MTRSRIAEEEKRQFENDGYIIIPELFDQEEVKLMLEVAHVDPRISQNIIPVSEVNKSEGDQSKFASDDTPGIAFSMRDSDGHESKIWIATSLGGDVFSAATRCHRIVDTIEDLLDDRAVYYHHKVMLKEPEVGGAWEWHQDYGYWYFEGGLFPDMASCMVALNPASRENGCLQVIKGSHRLGRIEHESMGEQAGANMDRVNAALESLEQIYVELDPGAALFFHSNLLHRSDANTSPDPRWTFISCYSTAGNRHFTEGSGFVAREAIEKVDDSAIREIACKQLEALASAETA